MMTLAELRAQFPADNFTLLAIILALPALGAIVNGVFGKRLGNQAVRMLALVAVGGSFLASVLACLMVAGSSAAGEASEPVRLTWTAYQWFEVTGRAAARTVNIDVAFSVDALSGTMALIVTGVLVTLRLSTSGSRDGTPAPAGG